MEKQPAIILYSKEELDNYISELIILTATNSGLSQYKKIYAIIEKDTNQVFDFKLYKPEHEPDTTDKSYYIIKLPDLYPTESYVTGIGYFYLGGEFIHPHSSRAYKYIIKNKFRITFSKDIRGDNVIIYDCNQFPIKEDIDYVTGKKNDSKDKIINKLNELGSKLDDINSKLEYLFNEDDEEETEEENTGTFDKPYKRPFYYYPLSDAEKYKRVRDSFKWEFAYAIIESDTKQCTAIHSTCIGIGCSDHILLDNETRSKYPLGYFYLNGRFVHPTDEQAKEWLDSLGYELVIKETEGE